MKSPRALGHCVGVGRVEEEEEEEEEEEGLDFLQVDLS